MAFSRSRHNKSFKPQSFKPQNKSFKPQNKTFNPHKKSVKPQILTRRIRPILEGEPATNLMSTSKKVPTAKQLNVQTAIPARGTFNSRGTFRPFRSNRIYNTNGTNITSIKNLFPNKHGIYRHNVNTEEYHF